MSSAISAARAEAAATNPLELFFSPQKKRHLMIEEAAFYCAERRGFKPGHELEDWLTAERGINLACGQLGPNDG